jgi:5-methyltetrahydrofolate--homocysteine methyltransferase
VVGKLLGGERDEFARDNAARQEELRRQHRATLEARTLLPLAEARKRRTPITWRADDVPAPAFTGLRTVEPQLSELVEWIDWSPFFHAWEISGIFPALLDDPRVGTRARELYAEGRAMLDKIVRGKQLTARGVYGFLPAHSDGDDVVVDGTRFHFLRQQQEKDVCLCLADFIAPRDAGLRDHLGVFAVTTGHGIDPLVAAYERDHDDYSAIMVKAIADRLAEAFAEMLHRRARTDWGYGATESLDLPAVLAEKYRGIRPAFGYPACPDHTEKRTLFRILDAEARTGIQLTESCAMVPTAAVSGVYFAHPESKYFAVGRLGKDQVEDYARRKGIDRAEAERWLGPNLGY